MKKASKPPHMSPAEFRLAGHDTIDFVSRYMDQIDSYPVLSPVAPGSVYQSLPANPPQHGEPYSEVLKDLEDKIVPGLTHWQSPNFYAYFPTHASGPSILGDLLSSGFGIQGMLWSTSPACTELETLVLDWMVKIAGLPEHFHSSLSGGGVIQDSASSACLCAVVAAREKVFSSKPHLHLPDLAAYISNQTHSSGEKGLKIAGFRDDQIRKIDVDEHFRMRSDQLADAIAADIAAGRQPTFVCATIGTTSSLAVDPIPEIAALTQQHDLWLHVDAAHSGSATVCPEYRYLLDGLEHADSYCFNPHKWLLTNFDCDLFYVANKQDLVDALTFSPEYLKNKATESGHVFDYSGWQVSLGRRFRSLKLWLVIRHYGVEGLRAHIRKHTEMAAQITRWIEYDDEFELFQPTSLNLVCFRHKQGDAKTKQVVEKVNSSGKAFITHTILNGVYVIRLAVGAIRTELSHLEATWQVIKRTARD